LIVPPSFDTVHHFLSQITKFVVTVCSTKVYILLCCLTCRTLHVDINRGVTEFYTHLSLYLSCIVVSIYIYMYIDGFISCSFIIIAFKFKSKYIHIAIWENKFYKYTHDEVSHLFDLQCYIPFFHDHLKLVLFLVKIINPPAIQRFVFFRSH
jgi:hypothetical protein